MVNSMNMGGESYDWDDKKKAQAIVAAADYIIDRWQIC